MSRLVTLGFILILLSACATPYQPVGFRGGFSEMQLSQDIYQVTFNGNGFTSKNRVNQYLLIRAAELTQKHGYRYFLVLGANEQGDVSYVTTPTKVKGTANSFYSGNGYASGRNYQWNEVSNSSTNVVVEPGKTYQITKYENTIMIQMLKKLKPEQQALDAQIILKGRGSK